MESNDYIGDCTVDLDQMNDDIIRSIALCDYQVYGKLSQVNKRFNNALNQIRQYVEDKYRIKYAQLIDLSHVKYKIKDSRLSNYGNQFDIIVKKGITYMKIFRYVTGLDIQKDCGLFRGYNGLINEAKGDIVKLKITVTQKYQLPHLRYWDKIFPNSYLMFNFEVILQTKIIQGLVKTNIRPKDHQYDGKYLWESKFQYNNIDHTARIFASDRIVKDMKFNRFISTNLRTYNFYIDTHKNVFMNDRYVVWIKH